MHSCENFKMAKRNKKTADKVTILFCSFTSFDHVHSRVTQTCARLCSAHFLVVFLCTTALLCRSDTCHFIWGACGWTLSSQKCECKSFCHNGRTLNLKKTRWVRVQYQGLCQPTALWNESEHSWSDSLLEPCPPCATMRRLLEERTWCGNYVTKRSAQNSNSSSHCGLFCV